MSVLYTRQARDDLVGLIDVISEDNPGAAERMARRIRDVVKHLARMPMMGRVGRVDGTRELVIPGTPYLAVYRLADTDIQILRILHGAQLWPPQ